MAKNEISPEMKERLVKLAIGILTAVIGFLTGAGAQAATHLIR